jgi:exodeoxyribonuclease V
MSRKTISDALLVRQPAPRSISLTDDQAAATRAAVRWYKNRRKFQPVFQINGFAGTGKSSIIPYIIDDLGLEPERDVVFGTYTGKAALVLRKKGIPCRTIHSLIYDLVKTDRGEMVWKVKDGSAGPPSDVQSAKLVVLDECSMVPEEMAADLLSFGKPVIVLGDHGQLPPVNGRAAFSSHDPNAVLTQIHRQATENPIIRIAQMARTGELIPYGEYGGSVLVVPQHEIQTPQLLAAGQVICGHNNTRVRLNNKMRRALGLETPLPTGPDEKIICLRNDHRRGLLNGMFIQLDEIEAPERVGFRAVVFNEGGEATAGYCDQGEDDDGNPRPKKDRVYTGFFLDHQKFSPGRDENDWKLKRGMVEATFGYAITCHKSQGSQWDNVLVWDDDFGKTRQESSRWLYTAITRAAESLVIAA